MASSLIGGGWTRGKASSAAPEPATTPLLEASILWPWRWRTVRGSEGLRTSTGRWSENGREDADGDESLFFFLD